MRIPIPNHLRIPHDPANPLDSELMFATGPRFDGPSSILPSGHERYTNGDVEYRISDSGEVERFEFGCSINEKDVIWFCTDRGHFRRTEL